MSVISVLNFSPHSEPCGIGKYQEQFVAALCNYPSVNSKFFHISPNIYKSLPPRQKEEAKHQLSAQLRDCNILHIQHEFSFFANTDLLDIVRLAKDSGVYVFITIHTPPSLVWSHPELPPLTGVSSWRTRKLLKEQIQSFNKQFILPFQSADCIVTHNSLISSELAGLGVNSSRIHVLPLPIPQSPVLQNQQYSPISKNLRTHVDDVILCVIGFVAPTKGTHHALKALTFLPENYKLAIIGGIHPNDEESQYLDHLLDLVVSHNLQKRFFMTGYIQDDNELIRAVSDCDICLFPYDRRFYRAATSASINLATACHKPAVAFSSPAFVEIQGQNKSVVLCQHPNGYELAKTIMNLPVAELTEAASHYSEKASYYSVSHQMAELYLSMHK